MKPFGIRLGITLLVLTIVPSNRALGQYFGPTPKTGAEIRRSSVASDSVINELNSLLEALPMEAAIDMAASELLPLLEGWISESDAREMLEAGGITPDAVGKMNPILILGMYAVGDTTNLAHLGLPNSSDDVEAVRAQMVEFRKKQNDQTIWSPIMEGRRGIVRLYSDPAAVSGIRAIGRFAANIRKDQIFVTTDIIDGAIGPVPFGVTTAAVVTQSDSVAGQEIEGITSDLTRLVYNGGTLALRLTFPFLMAAGTDVEALASATLAGGLLGDLAESDALGASFTPSLDVNLRFRVLSLLEDSPVGSVLVPIRLGWAYSENDFGPEPFDYNSFGFFQIGFGIADPSGTFKLTALITKPFQKKVEDALPRLVLSLGAVR